MPKRFSTKDLVAREEPTDTRSGVGRFTFTDDYSVFHFGKMPDRIPDKGQACCRIAAFNFGLLADAGVRTHFRGFEPPARMEFTLLRVLDPRKRALGPDDINHLVPLQVIFRNTIPEGSSVLRRLRLGRLTPADIGLTEPPRAGTVLARPVVEYTTKLEEIDRFIGRAEAAAIGGLDDAQQAELEERARETDDIVTAHARGLGLLHADGKVEFGRDDRGRLILVDHAGTPDEARLLLDGAHVGKQVLRDHYTATGLQTRVEEWVREGRPRSTWPAPDPLPREVVELVAEMYRSLCEAWTGRKVWGARDLDQVLDRLADVVPTGRRQGGAESPALRTGVSWT
ncbi:MULTISPECIES: phosphoribosylaminoimidazolesuccinocarboxamide synthase [unclassified Streptomyces]|uniref:phosphoribosylaminoimidazolesuccinocarboxamide synthase n=1 Tax=unclassified Streptomyces TaxID=2593676 RepID=UPI00081E549A|nr:MULTISPECIES: phosphoribosylaminoimidazolesuccinocarboxamide synthase [unclassified Streptomyces]MYZ37333.1 phosphoribosylaminoimidazolesuccinocarboxamide synthase [Streptomyces sp. SID4917]SCF90572.1 phosphoribosylaminoimidazole-succinocarboxamide synthase [Streptomyces sp. MnatMP-M17]